MDMQAITNLITTVGFPIVCCLGLGLFMSKYISQQREDNINRENKLLQQIDKQNEVLMNINSNMDKMSTTLENMNQRLDILEQKLESK
ncbi:MAG: Phage protein [Oscillospiraceae bacterium]|jgi:uncharacterized protein HemX